MTKLIIPAIDIMGAKVVRLFKGDMDKSTVYGENPLEMAKTFIDMGVKRLHIVDLDGAKIGQAANYTVIEKIAALGGLKLELGGGIRDMAGAERWFAAGVNYLIIGTAAVKNPDFTTSLLQNHPGRIILGIDARKGKAATEGWYENSGINAIDIALKYKEHNVESVIYTDIDKDGTLQGLNLSETQSFAALSPFPVIASGGLSSSEDVRTVEALSGNIAGCIVGKAFYEGKIDLKALLKEFPQ